MTAATERLWRTADGRLVPDGHPDGEHLAYTPGDEIAAADEKHVGKARQTNPEDPKAAKVAANKAVAQADNK